MGNKPTGILVCAILFAICGLLDILVGLAMLLMGAAFEAAFLGAFAGTIIGLMSIFAVSIIIIGIVSLVVAYGIWNLNGWARIAGIVLAVISLIFIPVGTIMGLIILYFLLINEETKSAFK